MRLFNIFKPRRNGIIISQYSSLPRYFEIDGVTYDLDKLESVRKLPMFTTDFTVWGEMRTMPELLRLHAREVYDQNWDLFDAAMKKAQEYETYAALKKLDENRVNSLSAQSQVTSKTTEVDDIDNMDGYQFEAWCAKLLQRLDFCSIQRTGKSGDQGVDILAEKDGIKYAIQCKCYSSDLGNTPIQEVYAGKNFYRCHVGAVMTNRYFTAGGRKLAQTTGVLLWDRNWLEKAQEKCGNVPNRLPPTSIFNDELLPEAVDMVLGCGMVSVTFLQRALNIGYARAARMIDEMEELGIVGPFQGSKPRDILITLEDWDAMQ